MRNQLTRRFARRSSRRFAGTGCLLERLPAPRKATVTGDAASAGQAVPAGSGLPGRLLSLARSGAGLAGRPQRAAELLLRLIPNLKRVSPLRVRDAAIPRDCSAGRKLCIGALLQPSCAFVSVFGFHVTSPHVMSVCHDWQPCAWASTPRPCKCFITNE
jgi:hypothetical protein